MTETALNKFKKLYNDKRLLNLLLLLIIGPLCAMFFFLSISLFFLSGLFQLSVENSEVYKETNEEQLEKSVSRKYLDPDLDEEVFILSDQFDQIFTFEVEEGTEEADYLYEKYFIKSNLYAEYDRLTSLFNRELDTQLQIKLTDDQEHFEQLYGFDYQKRLPYAGLSSAGEILILIDPEKIYDKTGLKEAIAHELIHIYQFDSIEEGLYTYPFWFSEGSAQFFSGSKPYKSYETEISKSLDTLEKIDEALISGVPEETLAAYNIASLFIGHLSDEYGVDTMISLMLPNNPTPNFLSEFSARYIDSPQVKYEKWHELNYFSESINE